MSGEVLGQTTSTIAQWLGATLHFPGWLAAVAAVLVVIVVPLAAVIVPIAGVGTMMERKLAAAMQRRVGPNDARADGVIALLLFFLPREKRLPAAAKIVALPGLGWILNLTRRLGLIQLAADGVKSIAKEDLVPAAADSLVFRAAPYLAMAGSFLAFAVVPFAQHFTMADLSVGAVYVSGVTGLVVVGLVMAGWGSNNKWSLLGGMRAVAQIVSYEIPVALVIAIVVLWSGTMSLSQITAQQFHDGVFSLAGWNLFQSPLLFVAAVIFVIGSLAECNRTPFDLAEADSELVSGFNTEYSGMRWALFAMAEYVDMLLAGALFAVLFLGGYQSPLGEGWIVAQHPVVEVLIHAAIFGAKMVGLMVFFIWLRWTLPRLRVDQVMWLAWSRLVPLALVCLVGCAITLALAGPLTAAAPYGALTVQPHPSYGLGGAALSWLILGVPAILLVIFLRRHSRMAEHPALRRLTGEGA